MTNARLSLFVFGLYMVLAVGVGFMLMPMQVLSMFGLTAGDDVWIRFVGMLGSIIGVYYILVARNKLDAFIPWTVVMRFYAAAFMVLLVVLKMVGASLLVFAAVDAAAAAWTWSCLRTAK